MINQEKPTAVLIDTNLLLLYIVGVTNESFVTKHRRLQSFTGNDFAMLSDFLSQASSIITTSNVLTETSNLLKQSPRDLHLELMETFKTVINELNERCLNSKNIALQSLFSVLGLTDTGLLDDQFKTAILLTNDGMLHTQALTLGHPAVHFNELQF